MRTTIIPAQRALSSFRHPDTDNHVGGSRLSTAGRDGIDVVLEANYGALDGEARSERQQDAVLSPLGLIDAQNVFEYQ